MRTQNIQAGGLPKYSSQFENDYFTEVCSGSEAGSYLRLIDSVYHPGLGLRAIKKKRRTASYLDSFIRYRTHQPSCEYLGS